jgi:hypothetical protein
MRSIFSLCILAVSLAGCASQGPVNQYFPMARQKELFSASHWKILAAQTATELKATLPPGTRSVRIDQDDVSQFATGFYEFLATELVHRGISVSADQPDQKVIKVKVEVVDHFSGPPADPFAFTLLGAVAGLGVWLGESHNTLTSDAVLPVAIAAGGVIDAKRDLLPPSTGTEVIVSTAVFERGYRTAGKDDVFYIQTDNAGEYSPIVGQSISVVGS